MSSRNRRRASTANDIDSMKTSFPRETIVDYLNAFGGIQEEADEIEGKLSDDRYRAKSVDFIREQQFSSSNKRRSNSFAEMMIDDLMKTFMKSNEERERRGMRITTTPTAIILLLLLRDLILIQDQFQEVLLIF